ncbi:hypothetical protein GFY24_10140 [Nocardia sp. SYP-A9097]|uniref:hypothetical protein n=1 Tax=Nocardia sp. SYP-A9097 TaxID=2663237 RepID=UPI00129A1A54|nr:hypothetical protein [Nocardia sp. SYP-A9097]MRH87805.1 hypothetical protein [Nocardia sp. SYP-A9097]
MSPNQRFRAGVVAVSGALLLALASGPLTVATASAAPVNPNYPLATDPSAPGQQQKDEKPEKAIKLGGSVTTKVIDLYTGVVKCVLNIALPSVKCDL